MVRRFAPSKRIAIQNTVRQAAHNNVVVALLAVDGSIDSRAASVCLRLRFGSVAEGVVRGGVLTEVILIRPVRLSALIPLSEG